MSNPRLGWRQIYLFHYECKSNYSSKQLAIQTLFFIKSAPIDLSQNFPNHTPISRLNKVIVFPSSPQSPDPSSFKDRGLTVAISLHM